jgi:hypothetical protein
MHPTIAWATSVPIAATHAAHLAATMITTVATTPKERDHRYEHDHGGAPPPTSTSTTMHHHYDKSQLPQPWRTCSGSPQVRACKRELRRVERGQHLPVWRMLPPPWQCCWSC